MTKNKQLIILAVVLWVLVGFLYLKPAKHTDTTIRNPLTKTWELAKDQFAINIVKKQFESAPKLEPTPKQNVKIVRFSTTLKQQLLNLVNSNQGTYSIYIGGLGNTPPAVDINITKTFYAASLTKVPLLVAVFTKVEEGKINLNTEVTYISKDYESGDGSIQKGNPGDVYTVQDLVTKMIKQSDNVAKNMLVRVVRFNSVTEVFKKANAANTNFATNVTTTQDMINIFNYLYSQKYASEMLNLMTNTSFEDRLAKGLPDNTTFAHKIGSWPTTGSYHDCGIVDNTYFICVLTESTSFASAKTTMQAIATLTAASLNP